MLFEGKISFPKALIFRFSMMQEVPRNRKSPRVSCVVPALNEHDNLATLLPMLAEILVSISTRWEIIVVDDGSTDQTPVLMDTLTSRPGFRYLQLSRNFGKEAALSAGLEACGGDVVVLIDADLQHPVELIPLMMARWQTGLDMIYAVREKRTDETWFKRVGTKAFYGILSNGQSVDIPPGAGDFRLMDRQVVDALLALPERTRFMKGLYAWVGFTVGAIPYMPAARRHGSSHYSPLRLTTLALDGITAFSAGPLHLLNIIGFTLAALALGYGSYLVGDYLLYGNEVSGWTTIVTAIFFSSGINLIALGTIGTYIARIFDEVKQRPLYLVKRKLGEEMNGLGSAENHQ